MDENRESSVPPIKIAVVMAGGTLAAADQLGVTPVTVSNWIRRGSIPKMGAIALAALIDNQMSPQEISPAFTYERKQYRPKCKQKPREITGTSTHG